MKKTLWLALGLAMLAVPAAEAQPDYRKYLLFAGANTDSNVQVSRWLPIFGAKRVLIRTYSSRIAFSATDADSIYSDSLQAFTIELSDSVGGILAGPEGNYNFGADSFVVVAGAASDTAFKNVRFYPAPINKILRAPANGSGIHTWVFPTSPGLNTYDNIAIFGSNYLSVNATPLRRSTAAMSMSTTGKRVVGLKGFAMWAYVFY